MAHEAGHLFLHPQAFQFFSPKTISEYKSFVQSLPESLHSRMEYQAYSFAGLVLVPKGPLEQEVRGAIKKIIQVPTVREVEPDFAWSIIEEIVSKAFVVSADTVHRRIEYDGLRVKFPELR